MNNRFKALCYLFIFVHATAAVPAQTMVKSANRAELDSLILSHPALPAPQKLLEETHNNIEADSLPDIDSLTDAQVVFQVFKLADWSVSLENVFAQSASRATYARKGLEDDLSVAKNDKTYPKENLKELKSAFSQLKSLEKTAQKRKKEATATADFGLKTSKLDMAGMRKKLPKLHRLVMEQIKISKENTILQSAIDLNASVPANLPKMEPSAEAKTEKPPVGEMPKTAPAVSGALEKNEAKTSEKKPLPTKTWAKYDPQSDVMLHPPTRPCEFVFQGKDEFSGVFRKDLKREEWFTFTNDFMKSHLASKPHITCEAQVSASGSVIWLNLTFTILEQNARKTFGGLNKGSQAILKLIDGSAFPLVNMRQDGGETDESGQVTTFFAQFAMDKTLMKKLRQTEVDKIRVAWNKGFEDYEIYDVDLLQRQLKCLD